MPRQTLYFPAGMRAEMLAEAARQQRTLSAVARLAWKAARERIAAMPDATKEVA